MGSARFKDYYITRKENLNNIFDFKYILFAGSSLPFDENKLLLLLDNIINETSAFNNLRIVYRPHPWRMNYNEIFQKYGDNIITDPQIYENRNNRTVTFQPDLNYYNSLIKNSEFVISGLTSFLLESCIFYKQTIVLAHKEKGNITSPDKVYKNYVHFNKISEIPLVNICFDLNDLKDYCIKCFINNHTAYDYNKLKLIDDSMNNYVYNDNLSIRKRLSNIIDAII